MVGEARRVEADDEWLAGRRSNFMGWLRRRFRPLGSLGEAVSHAETGPYAGTPRDPQLRVEDGDKAYSTVRYTTGQVAYTSTSTSVNPDQCRRCGQALIEKHELEYVQDESTRVSAGAVRTCRSCQADSWLRHSQMPTASRARDNARRNVV